MPYSAAAVANAFLDLAKQEGRALTNMQLQKLAYIAHGYSLALLDEPLFYNHVHAWKWGPVIPKLYLPLHIYGAGEVTSPVPTDEPPVPPDSQQMAIIRSVWDAYGQFSASQLSAITHQEGTPWSETWRREQYDQITNDLVADYYRRLLNERTASEPQSA